MSAFRAPLLALTAALALPLCAAAATPSFYETTTTTISTAGLNLRSAQGVATLNARVRHAAIAVCGGSDSAELSEMAAMRQCQAQAINATRPYVQAAISAASRVEMAGR